MVVRFLAGILIIGAAILSTGSVAHSSVIEGGPDPLADTVSLGDLLAREGSVHILFVHGMRSNGPDDSKEFRKELLRRNGGGSQTKVGDPWRVSLGDVPDAWVGTRRIWSDDPVIGKTEWDASRPFVQRYELRLRQSPAKTIIVDEVNWWPLLFPIKCRLLLVPEHHLSGRDKRHINLCANGQDPFYPWISKRERDRLLATKPRSGGGPLANRWGKQELLNWGFSDAVIALGPMREYLAKTMEQAFGRAETGAQLAKAKYRVIVSESLGSFVVLDAFRKTGATSDYLRQTNLFYFFANQFALLELGRIEFTNQGGTSPSGEWSPAAPAQLPTRASPLTGLESLAGAKSGSFPHSAIGDESPPALQIIAFNDPSDLLTYDVPCIGNARVVNLYVRNAGSLFGLLANPSAAHTSHAENKAVWKVMLKRRTGEPPPPSGRCPR